MTTKKGHNYTQKNRKHLHLTALETYTYNKGQSCKQKHTRIGVFMIRMHFSPMPSIFFCLEGKKRNFIIETLKKEKNISIQWMCSCAEKSEEGWFERGKVCKSYNEIYHELFCYWKWLEMAAVEFNWKHQTINTQYPEIPHFKPNKNVCSLAFV